MRPGIFAHRVPLLAGILGAVSLFLPLAVLKENRIAAGTPVTVLFSGPLPAAAFVLFLILVVSAACLRRENRARFYWLGVIAALLLMGFIWALPRVSGETASARISLGAGVWIFAAVSYVLTDYGRRDIRPGPRKIISAVLAGVFLLLLLSPSWTKYSLYLEWQGRRTRIAEEFLNHVILTLSATLSAGALGFSFGVLAWSRPRLRPPLLGLVTTIQTVPSLALFGLLIAPLSILSFAFPVLRDFGIKGIGFTPAFIALTLYAMLPITQNTVTGLENVPAAVVEAGKGMGMNRRQLFLKIRLPLSFPVILTGLRTAGVGTVGNVAVAALIGAGGLGTLIFQGLGQSAYDLVLLGVIPIILLAFIADRLFAALHNRITPVLGQGGGLSD